MNPDTSILQKSYQLLKVVLMEAFHVEALLLAYPFENLQQIDHGIRAMVWTDYHDDNSKNALTLSPEPYQLLVIKSNLGFYNILVYISIGEYPEFISVGPFRDEELSADYYTQIIKDANLEPQHIASMKQVYERLPLAQADAVIKVTQHIISNFIPEFATIEPRNIQYSEQNREVNINTDIIQNYSAEYTEQYKMLLFSFLNKLKTGDFPEAKKAMTAYLDKNVFAMSTNLHNHKLDLHVLNDFCHLALLDTTIHPMHTLKLALSIKMKIDGTLSQTKLNQLPNEICRKYCMLVKNYANTEYSKLTREIISYIQLHLEEELSLASLAKHFERNASVLSNLFSQETKISLTKFIHQTRIQEAVRLFNTTNMSVSEVALSVGYQDFSYFSKVFSKSIGCSPKEYKKRL